MYIYITIILLCSLLTAQSNNDYFPKQTWRAASAQSQGLDQKQLEQFIKSLREDKLLKPVSSFLIIKNGYLVINEAFGSYNLNRPHTLQSVTKSIASTLIGVAIQQGYIENLDQAVLSFFPEYSNIKNLNDAKQSMNLRHALTMRTGHAWTGESHLGALNRFSGDKMKYVLDYEMEADPGKKWYYHSGIAILLGGLIQNVTKQSTIDFAKIYLFDPLNITSADWGWSHRGIPHTGGGLYLKPSDMARIGYLYLRNGNWEGKQILPAWWVKEASKRHVSYTETISNIKMSYGLMWWLLPLDKSNNTAEQAEILMAYGHWGQFIFIIPKYDMLVIWTNDSSATYADEIKPISLFYDYILPNVIK